MDRTERRVLVVEDERDIRETLADLLSEEGYEVVTAANGADALKVIERAGRPSLVLLDLMMPVMDGFTFEREVRQRPHVAGVPIVAVSAMTRDNAWHGFQAFVQKPFNLEKLLATVNELCLTGT